MEINCDNNSNSYNINFESENNSLLVLSKRESTLFIVNKYEFLFLGKVRQYTDKAIVFIFFLQRTTSHVYFASSLYN